MHKRREEDIQTWEDIKQERNQRFEEMIRQSEDKKQQQNQRNQQREEEIRQREDKKQQRNQRREEENRQREDKKQQQREDKKQQQNQRREEEEIRQRADKTENLEELNDFRKELRSGIDKSDTKLIGANGIILEKDKNGIKQPNSGDTVDLFENGLMLIPESDATVAQAAIMLKELEATVEDGAILTGKKYTDRNDPELTRSYFVVQDAAFFEMPTDFGSELLKRKQSFDDLYIRRGKKKHKIFTDNLKVNWYAALCAKHTHQDTKFLNPNKCLLCRKLEKP